MGQVTLTLNGRTYRIGCGEGEEPRLRALGEHLSAKIDAVVREFGHVGESRIFMLAALLIADELMEARAERDVAASTAAAAALREIAERSKPTGRTASPPTAPLPGETQAGPSAEPVQNEEHESPASTAPAASSRKAGAA